jgi:spermidine synthase
VTPGPRRRPRVERLRDLDRPTGRVLLVDGVEQSYVDDDPTHLEFEYMQHMALVLDLVTPTGTPVRAVHLGGGGLTMARWLAASRDGSVQIAFESAEDVLEAVRALAPVACEVVVDDAVHAITDLPAGDTDVVIWDLYDGPRAVTDGLTLESVLAIRRLLTDGGVALLNVSDATPFEVVRPVLAALRSSFDDVALLAEPGTLRGRRSGNCVLVGAMGRALPHHSIVRAGAAAPVRASVLSGAALDAFIGTAIPATVAAPLPAPDRLRGRAFL